MRQVILDRTESSDEGTFGWLRVLDEVTGDEKFSCATVELPWRDNKPMASCIPPGVYEFRWRKDSPAHGEVYEMAVGDGQKIARANIQVHAANLAGDEEKGYVKQLDGCIAPGRSVVQFLAGKKPAGSRDQRGVSASKSTLIDLVAALRKEPFVLTVKEAA